MASKVGDLATEIQSEQDNIAASHHKISSVSTANRPGEGGGTNASVTAVVGMIIYNTTLGMLQQYNAQGWASIDSPPTITSLNYPGDDTALDTVGVYTDATCDYNNDPTITHDSNTKMAIGMTVSGTGIPAGATIASVTSATAFELSASTTGGAVTNGTLTFNTQTLIITGTNFQAGATVTVDGTAPSTVTRDSVTQITITGTPAKAAATYTNGLVVTNPTGLSGSINVDYSALPAWTTASGNVLNAFNSTISTIDLAATSATSYAITSGALPTGLSMSTSTGDITGTMNASAATYNFTVTATDAEAQSSPRAFTIISKGNQPTGGTITSYSGFHIHTFLLAQSGTSFTPSASVTADILVVAGGGQGSGNEGGGGGGAGGFKYWSQTDLTAQAYTVTVGDGGDSGTGTDNGEKGDNSQFGALSASEGGGGGGPHQTSAVGSMNGGSGGGSTGRGGAAGGTGASNQGNNGGLCAAGATPGSIDAGGGGGGASAVGGNAGSNAGANGGAGYTEGATVYDWESGSGTVTFPAAFKVGTGGNLSYAGGGGGGAESGTAGNGGTGGGGGADTAGTEGTGGGGGGNQATSGSQGNGGSGIVIIRYAA